jgi:uroporphyrinogen-III synthase|tara:strand:- start:299 stop:997 length:699 start_codon:yes stop_codon:yes gene_type:complete
MHILFTRPLEDSQELILKFKDLGHKVSHMPVIKIEKVEYEKINFEDYKAIIFTSANAIKFLDTKFIDKKIFCFCVGNSTEKKARSIGFQNVITADGNVRALQELILQNFNSAYGKMLYVSGEIISNNLDKNLVNLGYNVKRVVNYISKPNNQLDEEFMEKLKSNMPDIVYVYSQNSALSFLKLINNYKLNDLWMNTNLMCIGEKSSTVLNKIKWKKIFIFSPGEEEFLLYKI